jgi:hypothetical protein
MTHDSINKLKLVERIIVHEGGAHEDDFISAALALHLIGDVVDIERRDPTTAEIESERVLVLDVGKVYDPSKLCFDHHNWDDPRCKGECALSLFVKWLGLEEVFNLQRWYKALVMGDAIGPYAVAEDLGLPSFPFELESPVNRALLRQLEEGGSHLDSHLALVFTMKALGGTILEMAREFATRYNELSVRGEPVTRNGVKGVVVHEKLSDFDKYEVGQWLVDSGPWSEYAFVMYHSQRGEGWDFHRYNDAPSVNFSVLAERPGFDFVHGVGFFVQTTERLSVANALELVSDGLCAEAPRGWDKI